MRGMITGSVTGMLVGLLTAGCGEMTPAPSGQPAALAQATMAQAAKPRDGELALPGNYMVWSNVLTPNRCGSCLSITSG